MRAMRRLVGDLHVELDLSLEPCEGADDGEDAAARFAPLEGERKASLDAAPRLVHEAPAAL